MYVRNCELNDNALEEMFSNRDVKYGGWDAALAAISHEIDPTGSLGLAKGPPPQPVHPDMVITEGTVVAWMKTGTQAVRRVTPGTRGWQVDDAPGDVMSAIIQTLGRINKYGEPAFHLRDHLLTAAHYIVVDMMVTADAMHRDRHALWSGAFSSRARSTLVNLIADVAPHGPRTPADTRPVPANALTLDVFDRANAALDVVRATDSTGRVIGGFAVRDNYDAELIVNSLVSVASARGMFGGDAPAGSRQDAVACKAFQTLLWLAEPEQAHAELVRAQVLSAMAEEFTNPHRDMPKLRAARSALALAGVVTPDEAKAVQDTLFGYMLARDDGSHIGSLVVATAKSLVETMQGAAAPQFRAAFAQRVAMIQQGVEQHVAGPEEHKFVERWASIPPDPLSGKTGGPCATPAGEPRGHIFLFAVCTGGLRPIPRLYVGVPTVIEEDFESPVEKNEITLEIDTGTATQLTAKKVDPMGRIFRTDPFTPGGSR